MAIERRSLNVKLPPWPALRQLLLGAGALLVFGAYNQAIYLNERLLDKGVVVRLALAPLDPRSLMTGDYMRLRHALQNEVRIVSVDASGRSRSMVGSADWPAEANVFDDHDPLAQAGLVLPRTAPSTRTLPISDLDGYLIVTLDAHQVAQLVRAQPNSRPVAQGEVALRYRVRGKSLQLGTNAWFFEEGSGARFELARYGEYRVAPNGAMLLVRMLNERFEGL